MEEDFLSLILGSHIRAGVLRFLAFASPEKCFSAKEIKERVKAKNGQILGREIRFLTKIGVIKECRVQGKSRGGVALPRSVRSGFCLDRDFAMAQPLISFVRSTKMQTDDSIVKHLREVGRLKLVVVSGDFMGTHDQVTRIDMLLVADDIRERRLQEALKAIETEKGREVRYAAFSSKDFFYRLDVHDKLLRDLLDYPHHILLNKIGVF
ncbi:MAG: hypothetical protein AAB421_04255 [Patescibacteria group bacterium]